MSKLGGRAALSVCCEGHTLAPARFAKQIEVQVSRPPITSITLLTGGLDTGLVSIRSQWALAAQPTALLDHRAEKI